MKIDDVEDVMDQAIAMLVFMTSATVTLGELKRNLNDEELFGMQQHYYHIEEKLKAVRDCVGENTKLLSEASKITGEKKAARVHEIR